MSDPFETKPEGKEPFYGGSWSPAGMIQSSDAVSAYPRDLGGVSAVNPLERLRAEIQVARDMYRSVQGGEGAVDYARLAGAMAGALDNIAFFAEWCSQSSDPR